MKKIKTLIPSLGFSALLLCLNFNMIAQSPGKYVAGQQGPSGGAGGAYCDTYTQYPAYKLTSFTIRSGAYIDGISLTYDGGKAEPVAVICGGQGGSPRTIKLRPGEYVIRVMGKYNRFVEYLYIQTAGVANPQYVEFGNKDTGAQGYFDYQAVQGTKIGNFIVKGGQYVDAIGVVIQKQ